MRVLEISRVFCRDSKEDQAWGFIKDFKKKIHGSGVTFKRGRAYYTENRKRESRLDLEGRECKKNQPSGISEERNLNKLRKFKKTRIW